MKRVKAGGFSASIEAAWDIIPTALHPLVQVDFLCGTDPVFAGLHHYTNASYGRSYSNTAHCVYDFHQAHLPRRQRRCTIVLPTPAPPAVVVHEIGHALHQRLGFPGDVVPVTWYAATNRHEAFAEAFTAWLIPGYTKTAVDDRTGSLFAALTADRS